LRLAANNSIKHNAPRKIKAIAILDFDFREQCFEISAQQFEFIQEIGQHRIHFRVKYAGHGCASDEANRSTY
jgi:hypothetical protein